MMLLIFYHPLLKLMLVMLIHAPLLATFVFVFVMLKPIEEKKIESEQSVDLKIAFRNTKKYTDFPYKAECMQYVP